MRVKTIYWQFIDFTQNRISRNTFFAMTGSDRITIILSSMQSPLHIGIICCKKKHLEKIIDIGRRSVRCDSFLVSQRIQYISVLHFNIIYTSIS